MACRQLAIPAWTRVSSLGRQLWSKNDGSGL
jgi:hypothetical protein